MVCSVCGLPAYSVSCASLFCCLCRFVSRFRIRFFRSEICFSRVSFSPCNFFIVFMLLSFSMFKFLVCFWFFILIWFFYFLISLRSFFLSFSFCSFCLNMISCVLIFDFISTLSFTNICPVSFYFCSCFFRSLICWSLFDAWFILILSQFSNVLITASNFFFYWLIFVISFCLCCCFCLSFGCYSFNWSKCLFISYFSFIIVSLMLFTVSASFVLF